MMRFSLSRMSRRGSRPVLGGGSLREEVFPTRLYQASQRGDVKTVHRLQKLLMKSWSAKHLAVRRVTQDNQGKKTAGVDGVKSLTPPQRSRLAEVLELQPKAKPVRRVWIPKPGTQEKRGLGIPAMYDRASQALAKLALSRSGKPALKRTVMGFDQDAHVMMPSKRSSIVSATRPNTS
jgi:retron-type reverse transcriptase